MSEYNNPEDTLKENIKDLKGFLTNRKHIYYLLTSSEFKYGKHDIYFDSILDIIAGYHAEFLEPVFALVREQREASIQLLNNEDEYDEYNEMILNELNVTQHTASEENARIIFDMLFQRLAISLMDEIIDMTDDRTLEEKLIIEKWAMIASEYQLEGWYLGFGFLKTDKNRNVNKGTDDELIIHFQCSKEWYEKQKTSNVLRILESSIKRFEESYDKYYKIINAIKLMSLSPFLDEENITRIRELTKPTLSQLTPDVLTLFKEITRKDPLKDE